MADLMFPLPQPWVWLSALLLLILPAYGAYTLCSRVYYAGRPYTVPTSPPSTACVGTGTSLASKALQSLTKARSTDLSDRIYLLNYSVQPDSSLLFTIVGQSKDACVYHLRVGSSLYCSCEAFTRRPLTPDGESFTYADDPAGIRHCKHLFWLKLKILRMPLGHPMLYRLGYRQWELEYIASHAAFRAERAPPVMMEAYHHHTSAVIQVKPEPSNETCPFCFEGIVGTEPFEYCQAGCRSAFFHLPCLQDYQQYAARSGEEVKCPLCRAPLAAVATEAKTITRSGKERLSLSGMRPQRAGSKSKKRVSS